MTFAIKNGIERLTNNKNESVTKGDAVASLIDAIALIVLVTFAVLAMRQIVPLQQRAIIALFGCAATLIVLDVLTCFHKKGEKQAGLPKLKAKHMPLIADRKIYVLKRIYGLMLVKDCPLNQNYYELSVTTQGHLYVKDIKKNTIREWEYYGDLVDEQGPYTGIKHSKNHPGEGYPEAKPQYSIETLSLEESTFLINGLKTYLENGVWHIKSALMDRVQDGFIFTTMREGSIALKVDPQTRIIDFSKSYWRSYGWYYTDKAGKRCEVESFRDMPEEHRDKASYVDANKRPLTSKELEGVQEQLEKSDICD